MTSYYQYADYSENHNVSEVALSQPENTISQFLKNKVVNVYIIYTRKNTQDKVYNFVGRILLSRKNWEFSYLYSYEVASMSKSRVF